MIRNTWKRLQGLCAYYWWWVCVTVWYLSSQISIRFPFFILQLSSAVCLACECSAGTVQVGLFLLPLIGRLRLMVFCALFSLLITCLMIFLDISHIALMFPFNWTKVVRAVEHIIKRSKLNLVNLKNILCCWKFVNIYSSFSPSSEHVDVPEHWFNIYFELHAARPHGALCDGIHMGIQALQRHATSDRRKYQAPISYIVCSLTNSLPPPHVQLIGYLCALEALLLSGIASWPWSQYRQVPDDASELFIEDREMTPMSPINSTDLQLQPGSETGHSLGPYHQQGQSNGNATASDAYNQQQSSYNQKPYIPGRYRRTSFFIFYFFFMELSQLISFSTAKRPNELNQRPTLGHTQTARIKPNQRYREGYHYQPVASTSRQSPTFVVGDDLGAGPSTSRSNDNSSAW